MAEALLKIEHLNKAYGDNAILKDFNLTVHKGEVIVVIGPSGCGKSTLLRCINGLEPIQGGKIFLRDKVIDRKSKEIAQIRQKLEWCSRIMSFFLTKRYFKILFLHL